MSRGGQMRSSKTIYVRGIPDRIRHDDLKRAFTKYGKVLDITIPVDYYSGLSKGFCFIEYDDIRDAEEAQYRMDRSRAFGREIDVEFSRGHRKTPGEMRNRDRGDRRYGSDRGGYGGRGRSRSRSRSRTRSRTRSPPPPRYEPRSHHRERRRTRSRSNGPSNGHHHGSSGSHGMDRPGPPISNDRGNHYRSKSHSVSPRPVRNNSRGRSRSISRRSDKMNQSRSRTRSPSQ